MDARSILRPTSGIQCHRYGPMPSHRFHVPVPSLSFGDTEGPNRSCCFACHDFSSNRSLQSSSAIEFRVGKARKVHKNFAFNVEKGIWGSPSKGQDDIDVQGEVILQKASLLELTDYSATFADEKSDKLGKKVSLQLVSSNQIDPESGRGKTSEVFYLDWNPWDGPIVGDKHYKISFKWNTSLGEPGAFLIRNEHPREFFLKSVTLDVTGRGKIRFQCNSWIWPERVDKNDRVFFANKSYLPDATPEGLRTLRDRELVQLRGDGKGERKTWDRIYDYHVYNDLGNPDKDPSLRRNVLGGSEQLPYPRRCRTGRPPTKTDPKSESPSSSSFFIPPDERYPHADYTDIASHSIEASLSSLVPNIESKFSPEFKSFEDIKDLYVRGLPNPLNSLKSIGEAFKSPFKFVQELVDKAEDSPIINFPRPQVFDANENAWRIDEEFARQTLSGLTPMVIKRLQKFPPSSSLSAEEYEPQQSSITEEHIEKYLEGLSVSQATESKRLFVLDYHDVYIPYVARINSQSDNVKTYASRTVLFLTSSGIVKPVAIELSLGATTDRPAERHVYTPAEEGTEEGAVWLLAKTYVRVNEAAYHQVIGHWGMAVPDSTAPHGLRLVIEDYPYAVDGLEIWAALKKWVTEYLSLYYKSDTSIKGDKELQSWWKELLTVGHADIKEGWYKMESFPEMTEALTTIIWLASAMHANVNFGHYAYGGYMPNRPTMSRRLIPQKGSPEYSDLVKDPEAYLLKTVSEIKTTTTVMTQFEILSKHARNEVYIGQRKGSTPEWTDDVEVDEAFSRLSSALEQVEKNVMNRNNNPDLKNRLGPAKVPYTLLYPSTSDVSRTGGLTGRGVPNSACL
ncbi:linoleate 9S-lipoxygenase A isoform X2 [Cryptomeria japonica]|uniref:linoleate 9S-lipoxygenase A isoform X2 n=1 Tax=Cryptomeria japonica TaxID=3369 RepID=UPI0025AD220B|nr:linoleate 9S-lipoxygenase A isoform X2 [Cryptomeria japonica]